MTTETTRDLGISPHPPLTAYYRDTVDRLPFVKRLFDDTAADYDGITQIFSFGTGRWYRSHVLRRAGVGQGAHVLDLATGSGMVARAARDLVGSSGRVVAMDLSAGMLAVARRQAGIGFVRGTVDALPFSSERFDFVTMGYALRHVADLGASFQEFARMLRPGGKILLLEILRPTDSRTAALANAYLGRVVPALSRLAPSGRRARTLMRYYSDTIKHCVPPDTILSALRASGLDDAACRVECGMFATYSARRR